MSKPRKVGLVGLGVMGRALAQNILNNNFELIAYDVDQQARAELTMAHPAAKTTDSLAALAASLEAPRVILLLVPAGDIVDETLRALDEVLDRNDIVVDLGNSNFADTNRRCDLLASKGLRFIGSGISGGEEGARNGPALMPGGDPTAWSEVQPLLEAISARFNGEPCCNWVGDGGSGHYVKMVHNGIEYGDMQVIAEVYDLMHRGLGRSHEHIADLFARFNAGDLESYLLEIAVDVLRKRDADGTALIEKVLDAAGQKGTGKWTGISALDLGTPVSLIAEAVFARCVSSRIDERAALSSIFDQPAVLTVDDDTAFESDLADALFVARAVSYTQGFMLMSAASGEYGWELRLSNIARLWRGGCIIRSAMLEPIAAAFDRDPSLAVLFGDPWFANEFKRRLPGLRRVVAACVEAGLPVPCLASAVGFVDAMRSRRTSANMIQALRDCFGAHTFERVDSSRGQMFHSDWSSQSPE